MHTQCSAVHTRQGSDSTHLPPAKTPLLYSSHSWMHSSSTGMHLPIAVFKKVEVQLFARKLQSAYVFLLPCPSCKLNNCFYTSISKQDVQLQFVRSLSPLTFRQSPSCSTVFKNPVVQSPPSPFQPPLLFSSSLCSEDSMASSHIRPFFLQEERSSFFQARYSLTGLRFFCQSALPPRMNKPSSRLRTGFPTQKQPLCYSLSSAHTSPSPWCFTSSALRVPQPVSLSERHFLARLFSRSQNVACKSKSFRTPVF